MSTTTYAGVGQRTGAYAAPGGKRRVPVAPHNLPNKAGQVGPVGVKSGIVNSMHKGKK